MNLNPDVVYTLTSYPYLWYPGNKALLIVL